MTNRLRAGVLGALIVLGSCAPGLKSPAGAVSTPAPSGLEAASSGLCDARGALPDVPAAARAFINEAHEALHRLAADPGLSRPESARVLEAMQLVEADLAHNPTSTALDSELASLIAAANAGLEALGIGVPSCTT